MRTKMTLGLLGIVCLVAGLAHGDTIGLYADPSGMNCNIIASAGVVNVYVVHVTSGATASEFRAPKPACWNGATWIGDQDPFGGVCIGCGDSQTGRSRAYGMCLAGAVHILTISYFVPAPGEPCCLYPVLPHPGSPGGEVEIVDCEFTLRIATALTATVNGGAACPCGYPVPVEETTWGRMKALYTE